MTNWDHYHNFSEHEFACQCGCGRADMTQGFMVRLQRIRNVYGRSMKINSGFRCPVYNNDVSSTGGNGPHTTGQAADIQVSGKDAFNLANIAFSKGITGLGFKQKGAHDARFIHLDDIYGELRPWIWTY